MNHKVYYTAGIIILLLGLAVGIGYAYTAFVENSGNTGHDEYYIIVPSDGTDPVYSDSFDGDIGLNTQTISGNKVIYSLSQFDMISGHKYGPLGDIYLTVDETRSDDDYKVSVIVASGTGLNVTDFKYYALFQVGSAETEDDAKDAAEADTGTLVQLTAVAGDYIASTGTIDNDPDNDYTVVLLTIYVTMKDGDSVTKDLDDPVDTKVLNGVTFRFQAATV